MEFIGSVKNFKKILEKFKNDDEFYFKIEDKKKHRTLQQNKYMWKLIHQIAKVQFEDDYKIYLDAIKRADAKSEYVITSREMLEDLRQNFRGVEFIRYQDVNNHRCYVYKCYLGSSKMTTKEMRELLEILLDMASDVGLDLVYWKNIFYVKE